MMILLRRLRDWFLREPFTNPTGEDYYLWPARGKKRDA